MVDKQRIKENDRRTIRKTQNQRLTDWKSNLKETVTVCKKEGIKNQMGSSKEGVDHRMNTLPTDRPTRPTNQPTDTATYTGALSHLNNTGEKREKGK